MRAGRMGFLFIRKTASTGSSWTGALVAAGSLQAVCKEYKLQSYGLSAVSEKLIRRKKEEACASWKLDRMSLLDLDLRFLDMKLS
jgi:hypothetical protein